MDTEFKKINLFSTAALARHKEIFAILIILILLVSAGAGYLYYQYNKAAKELKKAKSQTSQNTAAPKEDEVRKIVNEVAKVVRVPQNELPSIATITDVSKLKDQPFFKDAKNGDILLVFNNSGKAILYDPREKKVVDVTTLSQTESFNQQFKVAIRNGTKTSGLAGKLETDLKKILGAVNVTSKENAQKETYEKTIVIVINDSAKEFASNVAKSINAQIEQMPEGEPKPNDADILIIIGKDRTGS